MGDKLQQLIDNSTVTNNFLTEVITDLYNSKAEKGQLSNYTTRVTFEGDVPFELALVDSGSGKFRLTPQIKDGELYKYLIISISSMGAIENIFEGYTGLAPNGSVYFNRMGGSLTLTDVKKNNLTYAFDFISNPVKVIAKRWKV